MSRMNETPGFRLYVGGLEPGLSDEDIRDVFAKGKLINVLGRIG